ncbi:hypothetical protein IscW_ISCW005832 [Ixodes scapularis]|uniref:Uncharacterized protein n=1 Tax=Ixodes scapularis TaxID=6945 RepID=B7PN95_IXOSC|nr:hypothetical protein IscW_ISCW005832 [Ixodes scapularis]|eukprot:XP_002435243.1 hypothetical protein IscW_ISCW005832 [Ixodes scapularis]
MVDMSTLRGVLWTINEAHEKDQDSLTAALRPLVSLLEGGLEQDAIGRATVAAYVGPTIAHLGHQLATLTREHRECAITRIAPELRQMVAKDWKDEGSSMLFEGGEAPSATGAEISANLRSFQYI